MERLKRDIPKFLDNPRVVTDIQKSWWNEFFANAEKTYSIGPEKSPAWLLDDLLVIKKRAMTEDVENTYNSTILQNQELSNPPIPAEISTLVHGPLANIPEVY